MVGASRRYFNNLNASCAPTWLDFPNDSSRTVTQNHQLFAVIPFALAAWWAREFAALGARREAWTCVRRTAGLRRRLALVRHLLVKPEPQAVWG